MHEFLVAVTLALVLEGLLYAAFPAFMKRTLETILQSPESQIRVIGLTTAIIVIILLFLLKS
jgi:uncharacterized protein YjeT (DUF2065 family)